MGCATVGPEKGVSDDPEVEVKLRPTVNWPVCLGFGLQIFVFYLTIAGLLMWVTLCDERTGL
jgi:hypothetical protein